MFRVRWIWIIALAVTTAGCDILPGITPDGGGGDDGSGQPVPGNENDNDNQNSGDAANTNDNSEPAGDDGDIPAEPENEPPRAVAKPAGAGGIRPGELRLDGRRGESAFLDASESFDPDGEITLYEWRIDGQTVEVGPSATIVNPQYGVTRVTLVVTDNDGVKDFDEIRIIRPGFREGQWRGLTTQGYEVAFVVGADQSLSGVRFGAEFAGQNILNNTPCFYAQANLECGTCDATIDRCLLDAAWQSSGTFGLSANCVDRGDPPFESAVGTAAAVPNSNCGGSAVVDWEAVWVSP